jgi:hypothetical protein
MGAKGTVAAPDEARALRVLGLRGLDSRSDWRPETTGHHRSPAGVTTREKLAYERPSRTDPISTY